jgi:hypothetical protein
MRPYGLCLAIPNDWEPLDDDPEAIAHRLDEQWSAYHLTPEARSRLLAARLAVIEQARDMGNVMWATKHSGTGTPDDPLSVLSLTVGVVAVPRAGGDDVDRDPGMPIPHAADPTNRRPLSMFYNTLSGGLQERHVTQTVDSFDRPLRIFQVEAFVVPNDHSAVVTVTVTTTDPAREAEAREVAERVASTLRFGPLVPAP